MNGGMREFDEKSITQAVDRAPRPNAATRDSSAS